MKLKFIRLLIAFTLVVGVLLPFNDAYLGKVEATVNSARILSKFDVYIRGEGGGDSGYRSIQDQTYMYSVDGKTVQTGTTVPVKAKWVTLTSFKIYYRGDSGSNSGYRNIQDQRYMYSVDGETVQTGTTVPANARWATLSSFKKYYRGDSGSNSGYRNIQDQKYMYSVDGETVQTGTTIPANARWATLSSFQAYTRGIKASSSGYYNINSQYFSNYQINIAPSINMSTKNQTISESGIAILSGTVNDPDGDKVTISATVGGKAKSTTVTGSGTWSLNWTGSELAEGTYSNITITANDGKGGMASTAYTGTITVDKTKPTITVSPTQRSTWDTSIVNISISMDDNLSGIVSRKYQLSSSSIPTSNWQTSENNSFNVSVNTEGEWYLHVSTEDAAGNQMTTTYGPYRFFTLSAPSNIRFTEVAATTLKLEWDTKSGHEYFVELHDKYNNIVKSSGWITAGVYTFTDLTPNALYKPYVKSRKYGKESSSQAGLQQYTDAEPVTSAIFEPLDKAIKITLNIDETGNDPDTEYIIKNIQTGQESPPVKKEWINDQLLNDMEYQFAAKVIHKNGKEGEWKLIGVGETIATKIEPPIGWEDPVGGLEPIDLENGEFDPDTIEGKVVWFHGKKAIVVKGRILHLSAKNVQNSKQYSISLTGIGYSDWKDLDETGSFTESIFINEPGFYEVHLKFKNTYGRESQPFVRNYLIDWVHPDVSTTAKIKGQTATTNGSFTVQATGTDNLSQIMYYNGSIWRIFSNNMDISLPVPMNNQRNDVNYKFSDLNGNIVQSTQQVWGINK